MQNVLRFLPSNAVGAVQHDIERRQFYVVTPQGVRKIETPVAQAVTQGYRALQQRHYVAIRRRTVVIVVLVIAAVVLAVFK